MHKCEIDKLTSRDQVNISQYTVDQYQGDCGGDEDVKLFFKTLNTCLKKLDKHYNQNKALNIDMELRRFSCSFDSYLNDNFENQYNLNAYQIYVLAYFLIDLNRRLHRSGHGVTGLADFKIRVSRYVKHECHMINQMYLAELHAYFVEQFHKARPLHYNDIVYANILQNFIDVELSDPYCCSQPINRKEVVFVLKLFKCTWTYLNDVLVHYLCGHNEFSNRPNSTDLSVDDKTVYTSCLRVVYSLSTLNSNLVDFSSRLKLDHELDQLFSFLHAYIFKEQNTAMEIQYDQLILLDMLLYATHESCCLPNGTSRMEPTIYWKYFFKCSLSTFGMQLCLNHLEKAMELVADTTDDCQHLDGILTANRLDCTLLKPIKTHKTVLNSDKNNNNSLYSFVSECNVKTSRMDVFRQFTANLNEIYANVNTDGFLRQLCAYSTDQLKTFSTDLALNTLVIDRLFDLFNVNYLQCRFGESLFPIIALWNHVLSDYLTGNFSSLLTVNDLNSEILCKKLVDFVHKVFASCMSLVNKNRDLYDLDESHLSQVFIVQFELFLVDTNNQCPNLTGSILTCICAIVEMHATRMEHAWPIVFSCLRKINFIELNKNVDLTQSDTLSDTSSETSVQNTQISLNLRFNALMDIVNVYLSLSSDGADVYTTSGMAFVDLLALLLSKFKADNGDSDDADDHNDPCESFDNNTSYDFTSFGYDDLLGSLARQSSHDSSDSYYKTILNSIETFVNKLVTMDTILGQKSLKASKQHKYDFNYAIVNHLDNMERYLSYDQMFQETFTAIRNGYNKMNENFNKRLANFINKSTNRSKFALLAYTFDVLNASVLNTPSQMESVYANEKLVKLMAMLISKFRNSDSLFVTYILVNLLLNNLNKTMLTMADDQQQTATFGNDGNMKPDKSLVSDKFFVAQLMAKQFEHLGNMLVELIELNKDNMVTDQLQYLIGNFHFAFLSILTGKLNSHCFPFDLNNLNYLENINRFLLMNFPNSNELHGIIINSLFLVNSITVKYLFVLHSNQVRLASHKLSNSFTNYAIKASAAKNSWHYSQIKCLFESAILMFNDHVDLKSVECDETDEGFHDCLRDFHLKFVMPKFDFSNDSSPIGDELNLIDFLNSMRFHVSFLTLLGSYSNNDECSKWLSWSEKRLLICLNYYTFDLCKNLEFSNQVKYLLGKIYKLKCNCFTFLIVLEKAFVNLSKLFVDSLVNLDSQVVVTFETEELYNHFFASLRDSVNKQIANEFHPSENCFDRVNFFESLFTESWLFFDFLLKQIRQEETFAQCLYYKQETRIADLLTRFFDDLLGNTQAYEKLRLFCIASKKSLFPEIFANFLEFSRSNESIKIKLKQDCILLDLKENH